MTEMFVLPFRPAYDSNGRFIPGAKAWFTLTGTNTPSPVYTSAALSTPHANPLVANAAGRFPVAFLNIPAVTYRLRVYDEDGVVGVSTPLEEYDPYTGAEQGSLGPTGPTGDAVGAVDARDFGLVVGVASNQAAAILDALSQANVSEVWIPEGDIWLGSPITVPSNKELRGAGLGKTVFKYLAAAAGNTGGMFTSAVTDVGVVFRDFSVDGQSVGLGGGAGQRIHTIVPRGTKFLVENIAVKDAYGYHFWPNGNTAATPASGILRNVHADNFDVAFETTHADGVLFDGGTAKRGAATMPHDAGIHPTANSRNITYRSITTTDARCLILANVGDAPGIVLEDCRVKMVVQDAPPLTIIGTAAVGTCYVKAVNCDFTKTLGGEATTSISKAVLEATQCQFLGGTVGVAAGLDGIALLSNCEVTGRTAGGGGITAWGTLTSDNGIIRQNGGRVSATGFAPQIQGGDVKIYNAILNPVASGPDFSEDIWITGTTGSFGTDYNLGQLRVSSNSGTVGNVSRQTLDHGDANGGQCYTESVLRASGYGDFNIRTRFSDGVAIRATFNETGLNLPAGEVFKIAGTQVVGAQGAAVADGVNAAAAPTQAEFNALVTQFNLLLARVRTATGHGLIA